MLIIFFEKYTPLSGGKGVYFQSNNHLQSQGSVEAYNKTIEIFYFCKRFNKRWVWFWRVNEFLAFYNYKKHSENNMLQD